MSTRTPTRLYFPGDPAQFEACVKRVFTDKGLRFVFSNRSKLPWILAEDGSKFYEGRSFEPGKDDAVRDTFTDGVIVTFGATLHRAVAAAEKMKDDGLTVGVVNKACLNTVDTEMMAKIAQAPRVLVAEELNVKTGLGSRFGSYLLQAGFTGRYDHIGVHAEGSGGLWASDGLPGVGPRGHREELPGADVVWPVPVDRGGGSARRIAVRGLPCPAWFTGPAGVPGG